MPWMALATVVFAASLTCFAEDKLPGFDSPERAFDAYLNGVVSEDFDLMLSSLTPEAKAYHIGLSLYSAVFLFSQDPAMQKVLREHGIEPSPGGGQTKEEPDQDAADRAFVEAMLKIKNPGKLMRQIADRHEQLAKLMATSRDSRVESERPTRQELISSVTLGKVTIKEDSAVAIVTVAAPAKSLFAALREKVQFRRIKNRWYCHIDPR